MASLREWLKIDMWCVNERDFLLSCLVLSHVVSGPEEALCFALLCFSSLRFVLIPLPPPLITPLQQCVCTHASQIRCTAMDSSAP